MIDRSHKLWPHFNRAGKNHPSNDLSRKQIAYHRYQKNSHQTTGEGNLGSNWEPHPDPPPLLKVCMIGKLQRIKKQNKTKQKTKQKTTKTKTKKNENVRITIKQDHITA